MKVFPRGSQDVRQKKDLVVNPHPVEAFQLLLAEAQPLELQHEPLVALTPHLDRRVVKLHQDVEQVQLLPQGLEPTVCDPVAVLLVRLLQRLEGNSHLQD